MTLQVDTIRSGSVATPASQPQPRAARRGLLVSWIAAAVGATIVWLAMRAYRLDDAYITYRVAQHVAQGQGLLYNLGERTLTTTAPGYALLLAPLALAGPAMPLLGLALSAISLALLAWLVWQLGARWIGFALVISSPLLLQSMGMETITQLALVVLGIWCARTGRPLWMGMALAAAVALRPDAVLPSLFTGLAFIAWHRRFPVAGLLSGLVIAAAMYGYIWWDFGSPFPVTLAAKQAQLTLGFYGYLDGITVWLSDMRALVPFPGWIAVLAVPGLLAGVVTALRRDGRWVWPVVLWAVSQSAAYTTLKVAGYTWYYAPIALALDVVLGIGAAGCFATLRDDTAATHGDPVGKPAAQGLRLVRATVASLSLLSVAAVLAAQLGVDVAFVRSLPEPRTGLYVQAGQWLQRTAPATATVGVMEVGVMGFYAQRTMIDFAGLTRPATIGALARGDIFWTIAHFEPDYLVLSNKNPLFSYDIQDDPWFQHAYHAVATFRDDRWPIGPLTIFQLNESEAVQPFAAPVGARYGSAVTLVNAQLDRTVVRPGDFIRLTAHWSLSTAFSGQWKLFAHLIDKTFKVFGGSDAAVSPGLWTLHQPVETVQFINVPGDLPPGPYFVELGWYDPQTLKRLPVIDSSGKPAGETVIIHPVQVIAGP